MQLAYKTQVQEWKNILLRGSDAAEREKYTQQFREQSEIVATSAEMLIASSADADVRTQIQEFQTAHETLNASYEGALVSFEASGGRNFSAADKALKGQDRPASEAIDKLAADLDEGVKQAVRSQNDSVDFVKRLMLMAGLPLVVLIGFLLTVSLRSISRLTSSIAVSATTLSASSGRLGESSDVLSANANETRDEAASASGMSSQVSANVQAVAAAVEEMTASISDISSNASIATSVANEASARAESANSAVAELGIASEQIGKVVEVINSIAEQTNLLALNATIEAARAGDAGKGFAVVANEVKELAKETSQATDEIGALVSGIQNKTGGVVDTIAEIARVIDQVNDLQTSIASAVEQQSVVASEIGSNVNEAARGVQTIVDSVDAVAGLARVTSDVAGQTRGSVSEIQTVINSLEQLVHVRQAAGTQSATPVVVGSRGPGDRFRTERSLHEREAEHVQR
jgi:hypothetical protein